MPAESPIASPQRCCQESLLKMSSVFVLRANQLQQKGAGSRHLPKSPISGGSEGIRILTEVLELNTYS